MFMTWLTKVQELISAGFRFLRALARQKKTGCIMQWNEKPVTRAVLKKYFGKDARIFGLEGCYRVATRNGGLVRIGPGERRWKLVKGGEDVHQALVLLAGECWGSLKVRGSREYVRGMIDHGEACGINVQRDFTDRRATFARWCVALLVFCIGATVVEDIRGPEAEVHSANWAAWIPLVLSLVVFSVMKRLARREELRKLENEAALRPLSAGNQRRGFADCE
jgi:hypothetical protein